MKSAILNVIIIDKSGKGELERKKGKMKEVAYEKRIKTKTMAGKTITDRTP